MDWTAVGAITSSISTARDIAKGLASARDQALISEKTSALLDQLLKAQEGLLAHNASLLQLQNEHFEACEELRKLKEAARERGRYSLVELIPGNFAYRVNIAPEQSGTGKPGSSEPLHYVCQSCFDKGVKAVLKYRQLHLLGDTWTCPSCESEIN